LVAVHRAERHELLTTLRGLGPDVPTLCPPWTGMQIASHLGAAEANAGLWWAAGWPTRRVLGPARTARLLARSQPLLERAMRRLERRGWSALLDRLGAGPPWLFGTATLTRVRLLEDWIHHEDVRRANGLQPRGADARLCAALVEGMELLATIPEFSTGRERIAAVLDDGTLLTGSQQPEVTVRGDPGEVLLALAGRLHAAEVAVDGRAELLDPMALAL
jgi:uncharacterized protein (TIGR03085 family)